jgi:hypothetical protein
MRPHGAIMTAVVGFADRNMINQCLLNRYIISYEPFNFKGMPSDFPETTAYGRKMDALRLDLREYFWDGEFTDKQGGKVIDAAGKEHPYYSVFTGTNGKTGMVICNYDDKPITVTVSFENGTPSQYRLVDEKSLQKIEAEGLVIPGRSAMVVI